MRTESIAWVFVLAACAPTPVPPATLFDSAVDAPRSDVGPVMVVDMGLHDAGATDTAVDAPGFDAGPVPDAGAMILVDGVLDDTYWTTASVSSNTVVAHTPFDGDVLMNFHYGRDAQWLYMGFAGMIVPGDAVVIYLDTRPGSGVPLVGGLGDTRSVVNTVLSLSLTAPADFQPEYGWGASAMPYHQTSGDDVIGWRTLAPNPTLFATISTSDTRSMCSGTACETMIPLSHLGVPTGGAITFVVRLGRAAGGAGFSNQTFPVSDTSSPELVSIPVSVP